MNNAAMKALSNAVGNPNDPKKKKKEEKSESKPVYGSKVGATTASGKTVTDKRTGTRSVRAKF